MCVTFIVVASLAVTVVLSLLAFLLFDCLSFGAALLCITLPALVSYICYTICSNVHPLFGCHCAVSLFEILPVVSQKQTARQTVC